MMQSYNIHLRILTRISFRGRSTLFRRSLHTSTVLNSIQNPSLISTEIPKHTNEFIEIEKQLTKQCMSFEQKLQLLLSNTKYIDIFDINLQNDEFSKLFILLVKYNINFNETEILGLGKLFKMIPLTTHNGINIIKNCGILNPSSIDQVHNVYKNSYNSKLRTLTISLLIQNRLYNDANEFLKLFEIIEPSNLREINKFKLKLAKFENFNHEIKASDIIQNNLIHLYFQELIKSDEFTLKQKFEYYLVSIFKILSIDPSYFNDTSYNQIRAIDSSFLSLLYPQHGINYNVFYSYFITLYPQSEKLIDDLGISPKPRITNMPKVNIRKELILKDSLPSMHDLSLLYSKYLTEVHPNRNSFKKLFKDYTIQVSNYQSHEQINSSVKHKSHPFSKFNHDTSILSSFIDYTFTNTDSFFKPKTISNLIIKFYTTLHISYIDHNKLINSLSHKKQIQKLIEYLLNLKKKDFDIEKSITLIQLLSNNNVYLNGSTYMKVIDCLIRLDFKIYAAKYYNFFINNPMISSKLSIDDVKPYCEKFDWPYPKYTVENQGDGIEFNKGFLIEKLSPEEIISSLEDSVNARKISKRND